MAARQLTLTQIPSRRQCTWRAVGSFMFYAGTIKLGQAKTALLPVFILMLLVFSAALTGALIFGQPVLWYMEGKKKEARSLLVFTLGIFFVIMLLAFACLTLLDWKYGYLT